MKACGGLDVKFYELLTSTLDSGELSDSRSGGFTAGCKAACTNLRRGLMGLKAGLND
jgi:hypothetical protein